MNKNFEEVLLDIVLPTYNNPLCVKYILEQLKQYSVSKFDFILSIYDSSTDDETKKIVNTYLSDRVFYHQMDSQLDVDEKTLLALKNSKAQYVYLIGDGYCPKVDVIFNSINFVKNKSEIIVLYEETWKPQKKFYKNLKKFEFYDKNEFYKVHFWQLILYGGSICKSELFDRVDTEQMISLYNTSGFIYPSVLATYSEGPYESKIGRFIDLVPYKKESGWLRNKNAIKIWTKNYYITINKLIDVLDISTINHIIKTTGKNTCFLTARGLVNFRLSDNYNFAKYKEYKFYLKKCKGCNSLIALTIAIFPKWILRFIKNIKKLLIK